ncbi:MAG TPA: hypothetical protein ENO24_08210 [Chloroflexi bacterium]|nr:hypothetical protein [Chloroflexota bacterium]
MARIGRNDPCPCGSGKKYKHCCLRKETLGQAEAMGRERAWETMAEKLLDFAREPRFQPDLVTAFDLFWNGVYTIDQVGSLEPGQVMNFLDWFAHDYRTASDGRRIVEIFVQERGGEISEHEKTAAQADSEALFSAFEVTAVEEGQSVHLSDQFSGEQAQVPHTPNLHGLKEGHVLLARLAQWDDSSRFSWISMLVPPEFEEDLRSYIEDMYARYQDEHYQASWAQFLRERSYLFNHFVLKVRGELPAPRVFLPYQKAEEAEARPIVLTPGQVQPRERKAVLVPGEDEESRVGSVLVPGRDR